MAAADRALALAGTRLWEPEVRRLRAVALADQGRPFAEVGAELDRATAVADRLAGPAARVEATRVALARHARRRRAPTSIATAGVAGLSGKPGTERRLANASETAAGPRSPS